MATIDFDKIPEMDMADIEGIIQNMDVDEVLAHINLARTRVLNTKEAHELPEKEHAVGILLARRFRAMRETKSGPKKSAGKKKTEVPSLDDLL